jgi:aminoglycoside/choline kinase family phosphotransferase
MNDSRLLDLQNWLQHILPTQHFQIKKLAGDASFRRYFRIHLSDKTLIAMDAPPDKENSQPFFAIAKAFSSLGIEVPHILNADLTKGFLLLSDLGDNLYLNELTDQNADELYSAALEVLPKIQSCEVIPDYHLPHFNQELYSRELQLFLDWFLKKHLHFSLDIQQEYLIANTFEKLITSALQQPQVCIHRDYHSRNLLHINQKTVGVLDFQDAVIGPITYDAVSLLRDCYIAWPEADTARWTLQYYQHLREQKLLASHSENEFLLWFDWIGVQRHLKVIGIFSRLCYRDGKPTYLEDIPRIFNYLLSVCDKHTELKEMKNFLSICHQLFLQR